MTTWVEFIEFKALCGPLGVEVPHAVTRGLELIEVAQAFATGPTGGLLELPDESVSAWVTDASLRQHDGGASYFGSTLGVEPGIRQFTEQLLEEMRNAMLPEIEAIVDQLRPRFDEAAAPLVTAAQMHGLTGATTAEQVIERADEGVSAAWRAVRPAVAAVAPFVRLRVKLSKMFDLAPTRADMERRFFLSNLGETRAEELDYSVCFAAGENWSYNGAYYVGGKSSGHLDLLAIAANGMRLNSPAEVLAKQDRKASLLL